MDFAREHGVKMEAIFYLLPGDTEEKRKYAQHRLLNRIAEVTGVASPKNCIRHTAATNMIEFKASPPWLISLDMVRVCWRIITA